MSESTCNWNVNLWRLLSIHRSVKPYLVRKITEKLFWHSYGSILVFSIFLIKFAIGVRHLPARTPKISTGNEKDDNDYLPFTICRNSGWYVNETGLFSSSRWKISERTEIQKRQSSPSLFFWSGYSELKFVCIYTFRIFCTSCKPCQNWSQPKRQFLGVNRAILTEREFPPYSIFWNKIVRF